MLRTSALPMCQWCASVCHFLRGHPWLSHNANHYVIVCHHTLRSYTSHQSCTYHYTYTSYMDLSTFTYHLQLSNIHSKKLSTSENLFWCFRLSQIEDFIQCLEGPNSTWKDHDRNLGVHLIQLWPYITTHFGL